MPYALFSQDAKISKAFVTEADVWKHAAENGLVVEVASAEESPETKRVLDNDYIIKPCPADLPEKRDPKMTDFKLDLPQTGAR